MNTAQQLKQDFDAAIEATGLAPSTIGMMCGYSGKLYKRLCEGHRIWPETADAIRAKLDALVKERTA